MVKLIVIIVMIATSVITSVVYHVTQKADIEYYQGHRYFAKGEYTSALSFYEKSLAVNPSHIKALKEFGYSCQWTGRYDDADVAFRKVLLLRPNDAPIVIALAETLSWQKRYPEAIALLRQTVSQAGDERALLDLAEIYQWDGQFKKSKELLRTLTGDRSKEVRARLLYAKALLYSGEPDGAAPILQALLLEDAIKKNEKLHIETEKLLAEAMMIRKDYPDAIERYRKQVRDNPQDMKARVMLADILSWAKRYDESIAEYKKALEIEPGNMEVKAKLARVYAWAKEYDKAEKLLRDVLAADPRDSVSRILLADMLSWEKKYAESIAEYERALEIAGEDAETMNKLAQVAAWSKDYESAERIYGVILTKDPSNKKARAALAAILSWHKKYAESIAEYEKVLAVDPDNIEISFALAEVSSWNRDYARAEELYRGVVAKDPGNMAARIALGELLLWQRKHREALDYFKTLLTENDDPKIKLMYGKALLYTADYPRSREIFNEILAGEPDNAEAKELLADSYAYDKEFKRAIELYTEALDKSYSRTTKRKLADVLSWDKKYDRALKMYDELIAEEEDNRIWLQKARVLGWARRYPESIKAYGLLVDRSADPIIKLEMEAKRAYWNDKVQGAISRYKKLINADPENVEAMFDLAQICSYQAMWKEAIGEYHRILELAPGHFRAKDGLEKAELIAHHVSWEPGYDFVQSDSQSRDNDIRKHMIFNKFEYPVRDNIRMEGVYRFTARSFSDFPDVVENEGKFKLAYLFNPNLWTDGYYDIIAYNRGISAIHTFGGSAHMRIADGSVGHFWYDRRRLENTSTVIREHYYSDDFMERLDVSIDKRLKLGVDFLYSSVSDNNQRWEPGFDILYYLSLDPMRLAVQYRYFYKQFQDTVPEYWSPKGFTQNSVTFNWRHYLNKEEIFFGANDLYYDLGYNFTIDSETIVGHHYTGGIHWDINKRLALDTQGGFSLSSNDVYRDMFAKVSLKYYY